MANSKLLMGLFVVLLLACTETPKTNDNSTADNIVIPTDEKIIEDNPFRVEMSRSTFDSLHTAELGKAIILPIYEKIFEDVEKEQEVVEMLGEEQKAFYYFWTMDNAVSEDGFIGLFQGDLGNKIPEISRSLKKMGDKKTAKILDGMLEDFEKNRTAFDEHAKKGTLPQLAKKLKWFKRFSSKYFDRQAETMETVEAYIRKHPDKFIVFTD